MKSNTPARLPLPQKPRTTLPLPLRTMEPALSYCTACVAVAQAELQLDLTIADIARGQAFASVQRQHTALPTPSPSPSRKRRSDFHERVQVILDACPSLAASGQRQMENTRGCNRSTQKPQPSEHTSSNLLDRCAQQEIDGRDGVALPGNLCPGQPHGARGSSTPV